MTHSRVMELTHMVAQCYAVAMLSLFHTWLDVWCESTLWLTMIAYNMVRDIIIVFYCCGNNIQNTYREMLTNQCGTTWLHIWVYREKTIDHEKSCLLGRWKFKAYIPILVTYHNRTLIFEWYVVMCDFENKHQKNCVFRRDWTTCSQNDNYCKLCSQ